MNILKKNIICFSAVLFGFIVSTITAQWDEVESAFQENGSLDTAFLIIGDASRGRLFSSAKGGATSSALFQTASLIKWITGGVILKLYEQGVLESLQDHPQKYLDWWTNSTEDPRSQVTLQQLLSFTSGFSGQPLTEDETPECVYDGNTTIDACAQEMYREWFSFEPGTTYYYGPCHHHVLGAIAEAATGMSWADVFATYMAAPLGMTSTAYTRPSVSNPRLSGGAVTTADDVEQFLWGLLEHGENAEWGPGLLDLMGIDNTPTDNVTIGYSAFSATSFHYGLSVWLECTESSWEECEANDPQHPSIISATGGLGFRAWIDRSNDSYGILAYEGEIGIATVVAMRAAIPLRPLVDAALVLESPPTASPITSSTTTATASPVVAAQTLPPTAVQSEATDPSSSCTANGSSLLVCLILSIIRFIID